MWFLGKTISHNMVGWWPGCSMGLMWNVYPDGHHDMARTMLRRVDCFSPRPWLLGFPTYLNSLTLRLVHSLPPPLSYLENPSSIWVFLMCSWCFWRLNHWIASLVEKEGILTSWKSASTSDLAYRASCGAWEGTKLPPLSLSSLIHTLNSFKGTFL